MPLLRINATPDGYVLHDSPQPAFRRIRHVASGGGPIIIMIHGYKYEPSHHLHCPHESLFCGTSTEAWPAKLRADKNDHNNTLCIAFGWPARGALRKVHQRARETAMALATLVRDLRSSAPHRPIHIIAHSLGSEVALSALRTLDQGSLTRVILLTGASHQADAEKMLATPAGRTLELINVTTRENDLFDLAFERLVPGNGAIGRGISAPNAVTVQLDCRASLCALGNFGLIVADARHKVSHWSVYTRAGAMALYARALHQPETVSLDRLRHVLPAATAPHFSRLWLRSQSPAEPLLLSLVQRLKKRIMGSKPAQGPRNEHAY